MKTIAVIAAVVINVEALPQLVHNTPAMILANRAQILHNLYKNQ